MYHDLTQPKLQVRFIIKTLLKKIWSALQSCAALNKLHFETWQSKEQSNVCDKNHPVWLHHLLHRPLSHQSSSPSTITYQLWLLRVANQFERATSFQDTADTIAFWIHTSFCINICERHNLKGKWGNGPLIAEPAGICETCAFVLGIFVGRGKCKAFLVAPYWAEIPLT